MKLHAIALAAAMATTVFGCANAEDDTAAAAVQPAATTAAVAATPAATAPTSNEFEYEFDTVHTQILFFVDHVGFSKSQGEFLVFDGGFNFTPDNWSDSNVSVSIDTASLTLNDEKWDKHVKNPDFFDVEKFPEMTFNSTKVESTDGKTGKVYGTLTMLDVSKPVVLDVTFNKAAVHPSSKRYVAGFSGTTTVKRSEFGMKYGVPVIGDDIEVRLEVEGMRKQ